MRITLTKRIVANAAPQDRPYELRDLTMKGLLLRVQPSGYKAWIVEWARGKRRTLAAAGHLSLDEARAQALQAMAEALQQQLPAIAMAAPTGMTLDVFLDEHYLPWATEELRSGPRAVARMRSAMPEFMALCLDDITLERAEAFWRERVYTGRGEDKRIVTKATAGRDLSCLSGVLSKAVEWKRLKSNPLLGMRQKSASAKKIVRYLNQHEEASLRKALAHRDAFIVASRESGNLWRSVRGRPLYPVIPRGGYGDHLTPVILLAMNTGLRRRELLTLQWTDIDLVDRMLTVREETAKSGKQRYVPLNAEAHAVLMQWRAQRGMEGAIFGISDVNASWGRVLEAAEIRNFRFHDLRHHFASRLVRAGVDLNTVRELLGHADIKMTLRYAHLCPQTLAAAVAKLAA